MQKNTMHLIAAIVSAVILIGTASGALALANSSGSSSGAEVPPGQLNRKGVSGIVSAVGGGSLDVATRHGIVTVNVDGGTSITGQGNTPLSLSDIAVDDRVSIQLNRAPSEPTTQMNLKVATVVHPPQPMMVLVAMAAHPPQPMTVQVVATDHLPQPMTDLVAATDHLPQPMTDLVAATAHLPQQTVALPLPRTAVRQLQQTRPQQVPWRLKKRR